MYSSPKDVIGAERFQQRRLESKPPRTDQEIFLNILKESGGKVFQDRPFVMKADGKYIREHEFFFTRADYKSIMKDSYFAIRFDESGSAVPYSFRALSSCRMDIPKVDGQEIFADVIVGAVTIQYEDMDDYLRPVL